jgi:hypothetical protein
MVTRFSGLDLSSYCGYFLDSVTVATALGGTAAISMTCGTDEHVVLTLSQVVRSPFAACQEPARGLPRHITFSSTTTTTPTWCGSG